MQYDSTLAQLMSVIRFAEALGFEYQEECHSFATYINGKMYYHSFDKLQRLHNNPVYMSTQCRLAAKHKIVYKSKLQWNKKNKEFTAQSHWVSFYD